MNSSARELAAAWLVLRESNPAEALRIDTQELLRYKSPSRTTAAPFCWSRTP